MGDNWEEGVEYGAGHVSLRQVLRNEYGQCKGSLFIQERFVERAVPVQDFGQWAKLMRKPGTFPDFLFRCAVAAMFKVQLIIRHLEVVDEGSLEPYISPVGPKRRLFMFWEHHDESWYWGHEVGVQCRKECGGATSAVQVSFTLPDIDTSGARSQGLALSGKASQAPRDAQCTGGNFNQLSQPILTYVKSMGYATGFVSEPLTGFSCEEEVFVHTRVTVGTEDQSFFSSVAGAMNNYNAGLTSTLKTIATQESIKSAVRAFINKNRKPIEELLRSVYEEIPEAYMYMRKGVESLGDVGFKPANLDLWVAMNMLGDYYHDNLFLRVVAMCLRLQLIVVNECGTCTPAVAHVFNAQQVQIWLLQVTSLR